MEVTHIPSYFSYSTHSSTQRNRHGICDFTHFAYTHETYNIEKRL